VLPKTLFWYIFKDLIRIFFLTSGALAGIMSFGGLLRPLTEHGLDLGQVGKMLSYFMPAMTTYSLPIAALFATTMVYGRLAADNEITAMRTAAISHLKMTIPALVLGLLVAMMSLLLLCFIVPALMLKAERVIFSNVAQIVANAIERNHQIKLSDSSRDAVTIFAQGAQVLAPDASRPDVQRVMLFSPMVVTYEAQSAAERAAHHPPVPKDFMMVNQAIASISQAKDNDDLTFTTELLQGVKFSRKTQGSMSAGIERTIFTATQQSLVRENTKFMNLLRLKELLQKPETSNRVRTVLSSFITAEQSQVYLKNLADSISRPTDEAWLASGDDAWIIRRGDALMDLRGQTLAIGAPRGSTDRPVQVREMRNGRDYRTLSANQIRVSAVPDNNARSMYVTIDFHDVISTLAAPRPSYQISFAMDMPQEIADIPRSRTPLDYAIAPNASPTLVKDLKRSLVVIGNNVTSELHARASFAISCLILVMVGCALGMMFKSGNFLTAFAVSLVPALISIALVITGQHTCENVPRDVTVNFRNSLDLGLGLIWSGNIAVAAIAAVLLTRLQRQ